MATKEKKKHYGWVCGWCQVGSYGFYTLPHLASADLDNDHFNSRVVSDGGCLCVEKVTHTSAMQVGHDADLSFNYPLRSQPQALDFHSGDARLHKGYPAYSVVYS